LDQPKSTLAKFLQPALAVTLLTFAVMNGNALRVMHTYYAWGGADFKIYMTAANMIRDGHASDLYDLDRQRRSQQELYPLWQVGNDPLPYNHPAAEALLFLPFTHMESASAYYVFFAVDLLMLFAALHLARVAMPSWNVGTRLPLMLFALAFYPVIMCLFLGQDSILLLLLYALSFHVIRRDHLFVGGMILGLGCFKPHLVLPFALLFFVSRRRWNAAFGFFTGGAVVFLISLWLSGLEGLFGFLHLNLETQRYRTWLFNPHLMADLRGLVQSALAERMEYLWTQSIIMIISIIFLVWCILKLNRMAPIVKSHGSEENMKIEFVFCVIANVLLAYHVYQYDLSILLLPLLLLVEQCAANAKPGHLWVMIGTALFFLIPLQTAANTYQLYYLFSLDLLMMVVILSRWMHNNNEELCQSAFSTSTRQA